ncbi:MAG: TRAP transporter small permease subunit [Gammaproteobacteria bacterium]|nr:TRAP transporter small permease subunit [Gammaproteobacteria bacterium]
MPELTFVLPHWLYWLGLIGFPLMAYFIFRQTAKRKSDQPRPPVSNALAYLFLVAGGFIGCHRMYLKSMLALPFVAIFVAILFVNADIRIERELASEARNEVTMVESRIKRAERNLKKAQDRLERRDNERNQRRVEEQLQKLEDARGRLPGAEERNEIAQQRYQDWQGYGSILGLVLLLMILADATQIPRLVRRRNEIESAELPEVFVCPVEDAEFDVTREKFAFNRLVARLNGFCGEFVAYWSAIAVFVYYYEVVSRYVFNSPTNWAHEAMFLMFGMQYLIAGGFVLREGGHVRVDVLYTNLSLRTRAMLDLVTSVFFFIFTVSLLVTGWIFFSDSFGQREVSFTEWHIQYYPVKFALPLGAALLILQGVAQLLNDIDRVLHPDDAVPEPEPEVHHGA